MATTYTFSQIKIEVAENAGYDDGSGAVLSSKDVTGTIIGKHINRRYYEIVQMLASKYPQDYEREGLMNFYKGTSTINAISSTTLTIDGTIFVSGMIGDKIYNSTQGSYTTIASVTSTSVVELAVAQSDWAATDTIYVLGSEFGLDVTGDDNRYPIGVGVKYKTTDTTFRTCEFTTKPNAFRVGDEVYNQSSPQWYRTNVKVSGSAIPAIGVLPEALSNIANGIKLRYVEFPAKLSADGDVPQLPMGGDQLLIAGATIDTLRKLKRMDEVQHYEAEWRVGKSEVAMNYARSLTQSNQGNITDRYYKMRTRRI